MKIGDIIFFNKRKDIVTRGISLFTRSQFTHVGIVYEITPTTIIIAEALAEGFIPNEYSLEDIVPLINKSKMVVKRAENIDGNKAKEIIKTKFGRPYGFIDIVKIAIYKITGLKLGKDDPQRLICSEAVARVIVKCNPTINLSKEYNKPFGYITPADLFHSKHLKFINPF